MKKFIYILCLFILNQALLYHCVHGAFVPIDYPTNIEWQKQNPQLRTPIERSRKTPTSTIYPSSLWQRFSNWLNTSINQFRKAYELNKSSQVYQMTSPEEEVGKIKRDYEAAKSKTEKEIGELEKKDAELNKQRDTLKDEIDRIKEKMNEEYQKPINERNMDEYSNLRKLSEKLTNQYTELFDPHMENLRNRDKLKEEKRRIEKEHNQQLQKIKESRTLEKRMVNPTREAQEEFTKTIEGNIPVEHPNVTPSSYLDQFKQQWQELKQRPIEPTTPVEKALSETIDHQEINPDIAHKAREQLKKRWEKSRLGQWFSGRK